MGSCRDNAFIDTVDNVESVGSVARDDFEDVLEPAFLVAGIDSLRRIGDVEIDLPSQTRRLFKDWHAGVLGYARIHGRFKHHDIASLERRRNNCAGLSERLQ